MTAAGAAAPATAGRVLSVNVGRPHASQWTGPGITGIDKQPVSGPVMVTVPGAKGTGEVGLAGDRVYDVRNHGGPDQAVYAYAREDLDCWEPELRRDLPGGVFGENLTTYGLDVNGTEVGERWRVGTRLILEATCPRIPCRTFQGWLDRAGWVKRFTVAAMPGTFFRVIEPGPVQADDPVEILHRPGHGVTIALVFRAVTLEPELLPRLAVADALPAGIREQALRRTAAGKG